MDRDKRIVTFLTPAEIDALIAAPDQSRWEGRRDRALILLAVQTGLRVSELTSLNYVPSLAAHQQQPCFEADSVNATVDQQTPCSPPAWDDG